MTNLKTDLNLNWDWHSHLSVLKFFLHEYEIGLTVEHGTGLHSTPIIKKYSKEYCGLEENEMFMVEMILKGTYNGEDVHKLDTPEGIELFTKYSDFTEDQKKQLDEIYESTYEIIDLVYGDVKGLRLLFIDGYAGTRTTFFEKMHEMFDIIIIHDTEPGSYKDEYQYTFKQDKYKKLYDIFSVTTPVPYTSFLIKKSIPIQLDVLREYMDDYCDLLEWEHDKMQIISEL